MLIQIAGIIFPVFAVIAVGFFYGRRHRPDMRVVNQINMGIFVPGLVFFALAGKSVDVTEVRTIALGGACVVLGAGLVAWPVMRLCGFAPRTFLPPVMFKNAGNMGLPLLFLAFGDAGLPAAVVLFLVENSLHFAIATAWLGGHTRLWILLKEPVLVAGMAGVAVGMSQVQLWPPLLAAVRMVGEVSTGLMLFSLGVRLTMAPFAQWRIGLVAGCATPLSGMLVAWLFCLAVGLQGMDAAILLAFGALPPAVLNFMFAEKYGQEPEKVAAIVIVGNLLALFFVSAALAVGLSGMRA